MELNCHVISLASAVERRAFMTEQFGKAGVGFEYFDAVDADTLDIDKTGYVPNMNLICTKRRSELDPSEVACFESHRKLWERCIHDDSDHIAIFEDDIVLTTDFRDTLRLLAERIGDHDAIKLDWIPLKVMLSGIGDIYPGRQLGSLTGWMQSSAAYILSNAGARKLLIDSQRYCDVLDGFVFSPRPGWDVKQLVEPIAAQGIFLPEAIRARFPSTVTNGQRGQLVRQTLGRCTVREHEATQNPDLQDQT